jgi:hypothetical protein
MRTFHYSQNEFGQVVSYELDMPTPVGLSGAPLVDRRTRTVIGVVYGTNDVALIEELSTVDPESGSRLPEIQRKVSFGLAHFTDSLRALTNDLTENMPLADFIQESDDVPAGNPSP